VRTELFDTRALEDCVADPNHPGTDVGNRHEGGIVLLPSDAKYGQHAKNEREDAPLSRHDLIWL
jgi:hypothetical protein